MNFCQQFLEFVKQSIPLKSDPDKHYIFHYNAKQRSITMRKDFLPSRPLIPPWYFFNVLLISLS